MKKILSILGLVGVIGLGSFTFASDAIVEKDYDSRGYGFMRDYHREEVNKALENKEISQEEAEKWNKHHDYMDEFHKENGYGACHGRSRGRGHRIGRMMGRRHR